MNMPMTPAAANTATSTPRHELSGCATRASMNTPSTNTMIAQVVRNADKSAALFTSQPITSGNSHDDSSTDNAIATPPGSAKYTTRRRKPGM